MGLEFDLRIATEAEVSKVESDLANLSGVRVDPSGMSAIGLESIVVTRPTGWASRDQIRERFAIFPVVTVSFDVDCDEDDEFGYVGVATTLELSMRLLDSLRADALLLLNGETPVFARVGGRLTVNSTYFADDPRVAILGSVHSKQPMPVL